MCIIDGDIGYPFQPFYEYFLEKISGLFSHIIIIHGNHEYYQLGKYQKNKTVNEIKEKTIEICKKFNNIHFLDNSFIDLPDENGVMYRFIGSTLWTHIYMPQFMVNDKYNIENFTSENNNKWFKNNIKYLDNIIVRVTI